MEKGEMKTLRQAMGKHSIISFLPAWAMTLVFAALSASCADDFSADSRSSIDKEAAVLFSVTDAQTDALSRASAGGTRAIVSTSEPSCDIRPADLVTKRLSAETSFGAQACIIESTVKGICPQMPTPGTRAVITNAIEADFTSFGYRGKTADGITAAPEWFYNAKTRKDGTLYNPLLWSWNFRYGRFYGIYPLVEANPAAMQLSPQSQAGPPQLTYTVPTDVKKQLDVMTACSGAVTYETRGTAPTTNLAFRHALTAVQFAVGQNLSFNKTIDRVEIRNAMSR